ncbi:MAG: hypothetical protein K1X66_03440 [Verrucomicrobiae bacterium]|nr:hypothetical protein [Verrucomicrobiae bacterium]
MISPTLETGITGISSSSQLPVHHLQPVVDSAMNSASQGLEAVDSVALTSINLLAL